MKNHLQRIGYAGVFLFGSLICFQIAPPVAHAALTSWGSGYYWCTTPDGNPQYVPQTCQYNWWQGGGTYDCSYYVSASCIYDDSTDEATVSDDYSYPIQVMLDAMCWNDSYCPDSGYRAPVYYWYNVTALTTPAPTVSLSVSSNNVPNGTPVTLSWSSTDATSCYNNFGGGGGGSGSIQVTPQADSYTDYYEICDNINGEARADQGVSTYGICTSTANACGQTNTGICPQSPPANPAGYGNACTSAANSCGQTNTGTIQCDSSCSATTPSNAGCTPPTVSFGTPTTIVPGASAPLTWSSTNATSCTGSGFTAGPPSGSVSVSPVVTTNYGLLCTGPGGTKNALPVAITVGCSGIPNPTITASVNRVTPNSSVTINWTAGNYIGTCSVTENGTPIGSVVGSSCSVPTPGSASVTITKQTTYTINCNGTTASTIVNLIPGFQEF